jgi:hypothetical protein
VPSLPVATEHRTKPGPHLNLYYIIRRRHPQLARVGFMRAYAVSRCIFTSGALPGRARTPGMIRGHLRHPTPPRPRYHATWHARRSAPAAAAASAHSHLASCLVSSLASSLASPLASSSRASSCRASSSRASSSRDSSYRASSSRASSSRASSYRTSSSRAFSCRAFSCRNSASGCIASSPVRFSKPTVS